MAKKPKVEITAVGKTDVAEVPLVGSAVGLADAPSVPGQAPAGPSSIDLAAADGQAVDALAELEDNWAEEELAHDQRQAEGAAGGQEVKPFEGEVLVNWFVGKVLSLEGELKRLKDQYDNVRRRLEGRLEGVGRRFKPRVENWVQQQLDARRAKVKYIDVQQGRVGLRKKNATCDWKDDADVQRFAESFEPAADAFEMVTPPPRPSIKVSVLTAAVEQWLAGDGQGIEPKGIEYKAPRDDLYVAAAK